MSARAFLDNTLQKAKSPSRRPRSLGRHPTKPWRAWVTGPCVRRVQSVPHHELQGWKHAPRCAYRDTTFPMATAHGFRALIPPCTKAAPSAPTRLITEATPQQALVSIAQPAASMRRQQRQSSDWSRPPIRKGGGRRLVQGRRRWARSSSWGLTCKASPTAATR